MNWDGVRRLEPALSQGDPRHALFDSACAQIIARFPRTIEHAGKTWWVTVSPGGPQGLAMVAMFETATADAPAHVYVARLPELSIV